MKVAVSSTGNGLESLVDPRFGRCNAFVVVDTETMDAEVITNSSIAAAHGAGIGAAQAVANTGAKAVLTGHVGPNAHMALSQAGVKTYIGASGTVQQAVEAYGRGELKEVSSPTVGGHFGQGGRGAGRGQGRLRG